MAELNTPSSASCCSRAAQETCCDSADKQACCDRRGRRRNAAGECIEHLEGQGRTVVAVSRDGQALGVIALGDQLPAAAAQTVQRLRDLGIEPRVGDSETWAS